MDNACRSSLVMSPMGPRSPPAAALDLYGKRRQMVKVQVLEREIGLLQEELKSVEDVQPASICCKEVDDFVGAKPDPLVAIEKESHKPNPFWKSLWYFIWPLLLVNGKVLLQSYVDLLLHPLPASSTNSKLL
ncbi:hypothetical protein AB3S75_003877 [Citrus x aurantiifolia]